MKSTEAYFISHCDNETCDLGTFEYTCPHCDKAIIDYDVWWQQYDIWSGKPQIFKCNNCDESLVVSWNKKEFEYKVNAR